MASTVFPAASAASKTRYVVTLLSGTSYTVPAGCLYVNATLIGGGGNGGNSGSAVIGNKGLGGQIITSNVATTPGNTIAYAIAAAGGTTTFTGATSAVNGNGGKSTSAGDGSIGTAGASADNGGDGALNGTGGVGGQGKIELEYWV